MLYDAAWVRAGANGDDEVGFMVLRQDHVLVLRRHREAFVIREQQPSFAGVDRSGHLAHTGWPIVPYGYTDRPMSLAPGSPDEEAASGHLIANAREQVVELPLPSHVALVRVGIDEREEARVIGDLQPLSHSGLIWGTLPRPLAGYVADDPPFSWPTRHCRRRAHRRHAQ